MIYPSTCPALEFVGFDPSLDLNKPHPQAIARRSPSTVVRHRKPLSQGPGLASTPDLTGRIIRGRAPCPPLRWIETSFFVKFCCLRADPRTIHLLYAVFFLSGTYPSPFTPFHSAILPISI